jgi:hypothetical protein
LKPLSMGIEPPNHKAANLRRQQGVGQAEGCVGRTLLSAAFAVEKSRRTAGSFAF